MGVPPPPRGPNSPSCVIIKKKPMIIEAKSIEEFEGGVRYV